MTGAKAVENKLFTVSVGRTITQQAALAVLAPDRFAANAAVMAMVKSGADVHWEEGDVEQDTRVFHTELAHAEDRDGFMLPALASMDEGALPYYFEQIFTHSLYLKAYLDAVLTDARWRGVVFNIPKLADIPLPLLRRAYQDCTDFMTENEAAIRQVMPEFTEATPLVNASFDTGLDVVGEALFMSRNIQGPYFGTSVAGLELMVAAQAMGPCQLVRDAGYGEGSLAFDRQPAEPRIESSSLQESQNHG